MTAAAVLVAAIPKEQFQAKTVVAIDMVEGRGQAVQCSTLLASGHYAVVAALLLQWMFRYKWGLIHQALKGRRTKMPAQIAFLHTSVALVEPIRRLAQQLVDIKTFNMADESLLFEILDAGGITPSVTRRITRMAIGAEEAGAEAAVLTCSSASPVVPVVQASLRIPFLRIDEAMADEAVVKAKRIGLVATVETTMAPTRTLLLRKAEAAGKKVELIAELCSGAFRAFLAGDLGRYEELIAKGSRDLASRADVIVFAQGSMVPIAQRLQADIPVPILTPLESGVRYAGEVVRKRTDRP